MNMEEKIYLLNDWCEDTICITHYLLWNVCSYGKNTALCAENYPSGVQAPTLEEAINKAIDIILEG